MKYRVYLFGAKALSSLIPLLFAVITEKLVGAEALGSAITYLSIAFVIATVLRLGGENALPKYLTKAEQCQSGVTDVIKSEAILTLAAIVLLFLFGSLLVLLGTVKLNIATLIFFLSLSLSIMLFAQSIARGSGKALLSLKFELPVFYALCIAQIVILTLFSVDFNIAAIMVVNGLIVFAFSLCYIIANINLQISDFRHFRLRPLLRHREWYTLSSVSGLSTSWGAYALLSLMLGSEHFGQLYLLLRWMQPGLFLQTVLAILNVRQFGLASAASNLQGAYRRLRIGGFLSGGFCLLYMFFMLFLGGLFFAQYSNELFAPFSTASIVFAATAFALNAFMGNGVLLCNILGSAKVVTFITLCAFCAVYTPILYLSDVDSSFALIAIGSQMVFVNFGTRIFLWQRLRHG